MSAVRTPAARNTAIVAPPLSTAALAASQHLDTAGPSTRRLRPLLRLHLPALLRRQPQPLTTRRGNAIMTRTRAPRMCALQVTAAANTTTAATLRTTVALAATRCSANAASRPLPARPASSRARRPLYHRALLASLLSPPYLPARPALFITLRPATQFPAC